MNIDLAKMRLRYEPDTGLFYWIGRPNARVEPDSVAGTVRQNGYISITLDGKKYFAHRLAWLWMTGEIPETVDHLNCIRSDNRFANLRNVPSDMNAQNIRSRTKRNTSGFLGVCEVKPGRFRASLNSGKRSIYLGLFDTPQEAHQVYLEAKRKLHKGNTL